jgi:TonB family protein
LSVNRLPLADLCLAAAVSGSVHALLFAGVAWVEVDAGRELRKVKLRTVEVMRENRTAQKAEPEPAGENTPAPDDHAGIILEPEPAEPAPLPDEGNPFGEDGTMPLLADWEKLPGGDMPLLWERPAVQSVAVRVPHHRPGKGKKGMGGGAAAHGGQGEGGPGIPSPQVEELPVPLPAPPELPPSYPDAPPESLLREVPKGGLQMRGAEPLFDPGLKEELETQIYDQANYPPEARDVAAEGTVMVRFRLDREGRPDRVKAVGGEEVHPALREEAERMVREGGPYPIPTFRCTVDLFVAAAYLNTQAEKGERVVVVAPSGRDSVDSLAKKLAREEAANDPIEGWHVASYPVRVLFDLLPSGDLEVVSFEGDDRWKEVVLSHVEELVTTKDVGAFLRIPIQFNFEDF